MLLLATNAITDSSDRYWCCFTTSRATVLSLGTLVNFLSELELSSPDVALAGFALPLLAPFRGAAPIGTVRIAISSSARIGFRMVGVPRHSRRCAVLLHPA